MPSDGMGQRIKLSVPAHSQLVPVLQARREIRADLRPTDFGMSGLRQRAFLMKRGLQVPRSNIHETTVLTTAGAELAVAPHLQPGRLVVWDPLLPRSSSGRRAVLAGLRRTAKVVVIRTADALQLVAEGLPEELVAFVPFPITAPTIDTRDDRFVYAAGSAHRDWALLAESANLSGVQVVVATPDQVPQPLRNLGPLSPVEGRRVAAQATAIAVALRPTILPAGPLIVLDAIAMGKPVIATDSPGTRDYILHGTSGLLTPEGDARAFAEALIAVMTPSRREALVQGTIELSRKLEPDAIFGQLLELAQISPS